MPSGQPDPEIEFKYDYWGNSFRCFWMEKMKYFSYIHIFTYYTLDWLFPLVFISIIFFVYECNNFFLTSYLLKT